MIFQDRADAGRRLATKLQKYAGRSDAIVLALPRGGVPVGYEAARSLGVPSMCSSFASSAFLGTRNSRWVQSHRAGFAS